MHFSHIKYSCSLLQFISTPNKFHFAIKQKQYASLFWPDVVHLKDGKFYNRKSQSLPQRYKSVNETTQYSKLALKYNIQINMLLQHLDQ